MNHEWPGAVVDDVEAGLAFEREITRRLSKTIGERQLTARAEQHLSTIGQPERIELANGGGEPRRPHLHGRRLPGRYHGTPHEASARNDQHRCGSAKPRRAPT